MEHSRGQRIEAEIVIPVRWDDVRANGKVTGAMTGIEAARHERVVLADDDVRYDRPHLAAVVRALDDADLVLPQNYPTHLPWWAWWESGRVLLNRAVAADWPGTCAVRRSLVLAAGGWSADVLYENIEMARTIRAVGGRVVHRPDLLVARRPPPVRHFLRQRVRQAYEDQAEPLRLALGVAVVPTTLALARRPPSSPPERPWSSPRPRRVAGGRVASGPFRRRLPRSPDAGRGPLGALARAARPVPVGSPPTRRRRDGRPAVAGNGRCGAGYVKTPPHPHHRRRRYGQDST